MSEANPLLSNRTMQGAAKAVEGLLDQGKINEPITNEPQEKKADKVDTKKEEVNLKRKLLKKNLKINNNRKLKLRNNLRKLKIKYKHLKRKTLKKLKKLHYTK